MKPSLQTSVTSLLERVRSGATENTAAPEGLDTKKTKTFSFRAEKCCFPYCYYCVILVLLVLFRVSNSQWFGFWVF